MTSEDFAAGVEVRLINDPGRSGVLTGRSQERGETVHYQVIFPEGKSYQPEYELEIAGDDLDAFALIQEGRYGRISDLRRNLLHIQLSGRLANLVYSMDATNTDFYAYQYKPVLSFLDSPSNGLLIADEVGLGKTIEAGLIWTELRARYDARRLLVLCPAMLREKWCDELKDRFNIDANIVDAAELTKQLKEDKHSLPDGKGLVCSMQGLRPPKNWEEENSSESPRYKLTQLLDELSSSEPAIDLLIVDEAHYLRNPESQTAKLGNMLRDISEHIVLLSATPVNLKADDLFHLLNLVDPDTFTRKEYFPEILKANEPLQKARGLVLNKNTDAQKIIEALKEAADQKPLSDNRSLRNIIASGVNSDTLKERNGRVSLANKIERVNLLRNTVSRTRKAEVTEWRVLREPKTHFVKLNEIETAFYNDVTDVIREYATTSGISAGFLLVSPQRQVSSCMYAALRSWEKRQTQFAELLYEDLGQDPELQFDISPLIERLISEVLPNYNLTHMKESDSKFSIFQEVLSSYLSEYKEEKVIVFSYFRETLSYLSERLNEQGISNQILVGGMRQSKHEVINTFRDSSGIRVLLSSEVASEGVDLQFCRLLINYDLPWNPMKVEQRIGRLDRIGQKAKRISILNLCYEDTIDQRIVTRLFDRLDIFRRALGSMEAILGEQVKSLTEDFLRNELTPAQQEKRIDQTALAIEQKRMDQENLEKEASHLIAHQGYILEQVHAAHEFNKRIQARDIYIYVRDYMNKHCQGHILRQIDKDSLTFQIRLPDDTASKFNIFIKQYHLQGQSVLANGLLCDVVFQQKVNRFHGRREILSQFHPFIRFINHDLKERNESLYPLIAVRAQMNDRIKTPPGIYVFVVSTWFFEGLRTEEELRSIIVSLDGGEIIDSDQAWDFISHVRTQGEDWLSALNEVASDAVVTQLNIAAAKLREQFEVARKDRQIENEDRVSFQLQSAQKHKERQLETHNTVLEKLIENNNTRLIPARKGLITKVNERFSIQEARLREKVTLNSSADELCYGVIRVV